MKAKLLVILICLLGASTLHAQQFSTKGKDFYVSFMKNNSAMNASSLVLRLFFSADQTSTVIIRVPGQAPVTKTVTAGVIGSQDVNFNSAYNVLSNDPPRFSAIQITSNFPISVYAFNSTATSTDATLVIPVESLGNEYLTFNREHSNEPGNWRSEFMVVGVANNTRVEITPASEIVNSTGTPVRATGVPFQITLNRGDVYFAQGGIFSSTLRGDLSGTRIRLAPGSGCSNFAVFSGHERTSIPTATSNRDHLFEQMFPTKTWGTRFMVSPLAFARSSEIRVMAQNNNTTINAGSSGTFNLNAGRVQTLASVGGLLVMSANGPIAVAQYMKSNNDGNGQNPSGTVGDPFMMWIPPIEQTLDSIRFGAFDPGTTQNGWLQNIYVNVIVETSALAASRLDNASLASVPFILNNTAVIDGVSYTARAIRVSANNHTLTSPNGCIANLYGMAEFDSYGFLAGASLNNINMKVNFTGLNADTTICPNQQVRLDGFAQDSVQVSSWRWLLPDGSQPTTKSVTVSFPDTGIFNIRLVVERNSDCKFDTVATTISVRSSVRPVIRDTSVCKDQVIQLVLTVTGGTAPYSYLWTALNNLTLVSGQGTSSPGISGSASGPSRIAVNVTDANGCLGYDTATVVVHPLPLMTAIQPDTICDNEAATLTSTASGGTPGYRYQWMPPFGIVSGASTPSITLRLDSAGTYSYVLTVTDTNGCTVADSGRVVVRQSPIVSGGTDLMVLCIGDTVPLGSTATVTGGLTPYRLLWRRLSTGNANIVTDTTLQTRIYPTLPGLYELTATGANGCVGRDTVFVDVRLIPDANAGSDVEECVCVKTGKQIGVLSRCGVPPFVYVWSALGTAPIAALSATNTVPVTCNVNQSPAATTVYQYVLTVTDAQNQTRSDTVDYVLHPCPVVDAGADANFCGADTLKIKPTITIESTDSIQYTWSPVTFLDDATIAEPTAVLPDSDISIQYTFTVRTKYGCSGSDVINVRTSTTLKVTASVQKSRPLCICRGDEVTLSAAVGGGTAPFNYQWTPSAAVTDPTAQSPKSSPLTDTRYVVLVTDSRGCTGTDTIDVCVEPVPNPRPGQDTTICFGNSVQRGEVATCGKAPFVYAWSPTTGISDPAIFNPIFSPAVTTTYTLKVTDAGGASNSANLTISINELPVVNVGADTAFCAGGSASIVTISSKGKPGYSYRWFIDSLALPDTTSAILIPDMTKTSTIRCVISDQNGCESPDEKIITVFPAPFLDMQSELFVCPCDSIRIGADAINGTAPYRYKWSDISGGPALELNSDTIATPIAVLTQSRVYSVAVSDSRGCTTSGVQAIQLGEGAMPAPFSVPNVVTDPHNKNAAIPIALVDYPQNQRCPPRSLSFSVDYDAWLYDPKPALSAGTIISNTLNGRIRTLRINIAPVPLYQANAVVTTLTGAAILGDPGFTTVMVKDVVWGCSQLVSDTTSGTLTLDSLCLKPNGTKRLLQFNEQPGIVSIAPNPANEITYVTMKRYHGEELQLHLVTVEGTEIKSLSWTEGLSFENATHEETLTLPLELKITQGVYRLVLRSKEGMCSEQLVIIH